MKGYHFKLHDVELFVFAGCSCCATAEYSLRSGVCVPPDGATVFQIERPCASSVWQQQHQWPSADSLTTKNKNNYRIK